MEGIGKLIKEKLTWNERQEKVPRVDFFLLFLFAALFILAQNSWISYLPPDQGNMEEVQNSVRHFLYLQYQPLRLSPTITDYPPLIYLISCGFFGLFGFSIKLTYFSSLFLTLFTIFALYGIGFFYGGRATGWLMVFLCLGNPKALYWGRFYTQNYPEMAFFATAFLLLLLSRGFTHKLYSALLGLLMGLSLLTRYAFFYLASAFAGAGLILAKKELKLWWKVLAALAGLAGLGIGGKLLFNFLYHSNVYALFRDNYLICQLIGLGLGITLLAINLKTRRNAPLANFFSALASALLIALPWFIAALDLQFNKGDMYAVTAGPKAIILKVFWIYLSLIYPGIVIMAGLGTIYLVYNWKSYPLQLLAAGFLGTMLLLACLIIDPLYRYSLPLQLYMVLLSVCWVGVLPKAGRYLLVGLALLWLSLNLGSVALVEGRLASPGTPLYRSARSVLHFSQYDNPVLEASGNVKNESPRRIILEDRYVRELARAIKQTTPVSPPLGLKVLFFNYIPDFSTYTWQMETYLLALKFFPEKKFSQDQPAVEYHFLNKKISGADFSNWHYLIIVAPGELEFSSAEQWFQDRNEKLLPVRRLEVRQTRLGEKVHFFLQLYKLEGR